MLISVDAPEEPAYYVDFKYIRLIKFNVQKLRAWEKEEWDKCYGGWHGTEAVTRKLS
jgi:hypothetical protein